MAKRILPCALTIAGSDCSGGAGIEADLKTFAALKVYAACVVTAITVQDTSRVYDVYLIPPTYVKSQLERALEDLPIKSAKTGMLYSKEIVKVVADTMRREDIPLVIDPTFRAGSGDPLIMEDAKKELIDDLFPLASVITPNVPEAEEISDLKIDTLKDMEEAANRILDLGPRSVVVKGGHLKGKEVVDIFCSREGLKVYHKPRLDVDTHGAGCTFSSAITAFLAHGNSIEESVDKAEKFIHDVIAFSLSVGKGRKPVHQLVHLYREAKK